MSFMIHLDDSNRLPQVQITYGKYWGEIFSFTSNYSMNISIRWRAYENGGYYNTIMYEGIQEIPRGDILGLEMYCEHKSDDVLNKIYDTYYAPVVDMIRTALVACVVEKLILACKEG